MQDLEIENEQQQQQRCLENGSKQKVNFRTAPTFQEISDVYHGPLIPLVFKAMQVHQQHHPVGEVQMSALVSIKTGGCPEDCAYCPQAARYHTNVQAQKLMDVETVVAEAQKMKELGVMRMCLGAAWREVKNNQDFKRVLEMVQSVGQLGMQVCCTLGMLNLEQAQRLKEAGLYAYNHNIDTSEDYYSEIISTRTFSQRIKTLENVREANLTVCTGGILGMGETHEDRIKMLAVLGNMSPHPESVPINALVPVAGTPLGSQTEKVSVWDMVRMIATARIFMPKSVVRLSAGRTEMTVEEQALCFLAGANSIFAGDKLLTTPNPGIKSDAEMMSLLGLHPKVVAVADNSEQSNVEERSAICH